MEKLNKSIPDTRMKSLYVIVTDTDGTITSTLYKNDKTYKTIEQAESDIRDYASKNNIEPFFLKYGVVDNKKKILGEN